MEIKTKFDVGDKVWFMDSNKATEAEIWEVYIKQYNVLGTNGRKEINITYMLKNLHLCYIGTFHEGKIYASKEELINSL